MPHAVRETSTSCQSCETFEMIEEQGAILEDRCIFTSSLGVIIASKCIACDAVGYHNHVFWDCPKVEEKFGPRPKASDPWQRRYGWPLARKDTQEIDKEVLRWMKTITIEIWNQRYGKDEKKTKTEAEIARKKVEFAAKLGAEHDREDQEEFERWMFAVDDFIGAQECEAEE